MQEVLHGMLVEPERLLVILGFILFCGFCHQINGFLEMQNTQPTRSRKPLGSRQQEYTDKRYCQTRESISCRPLCWPTCPTSTRKALKGSFKRQLFCFTIYSYSSKQLPSQSSGSLIKYLRLGLKRRVHFLFRNFRGKRNRAGLRACNRANSKTN